MLNYLLAVSISAFAFLVTAMVAPVPPSSQPTMLVFVAVFSVNIVLMFTVCLVVIDEKIRKLTMDKAVSAKEVATLKSRCEEGDEKIRKLTMDKAASAEEVTTLKSRCKEPHRYLARPNSTGTALERARRVEY